MAMPYILIVEDETKIARIIKAYLEGAGFRVTHVEKGKEAIETALKNPPQLVVLDLMLPDISGEEVLQEMQNIGKFPIMVLTAKSSEEERIAGFTLGADDYITKPFSPRELVLRVKAILKRSHDENSPGTEAASFNNGLLKLDGYSYEVKKKDSVINLTSTEFKILHVLSSSPGRVFTREELVEKALGYQFEGYDRSIDVHIKNIRRKIENDPKNPEFISTVYGVGYRFAGKKDA